MTGSWLDEPAVRNGIRRMLESRNDLIANGEHVIGWKLAFGAPAWLEKFGIPGPLVGFLPERLRHPNGAHVAIDGWTAPVAEPEIAVHIGSDVDHPDQVAGAISAIGPAIELANVDPPPDDLEEVLAGNVFHRGVIVGDVDAGRRGGDISGLIGQVTRDGSAVATTTDLEALTGELIPIMAHTVALLSVFGEKLRAGEIVIAGSVVPPLQIRSGEHIAFRLDPIGEVTVSV